ncbi:MAG: hypothetical protein HYU43_06970 [Armatimonadetes bacterium]|nr:hypothetical protein [Armatimonadota bacterium]
MTTVGHVIARHKLLILSLLAALALFASQVPMAQASPGNIVVTFDDPTGVGTPFGGDWTEKGVRVWTDETFKFGVVNWFPADGPDREINLGNNGRIIKVAKVDSSPFTLVSFWSAGLGPTQVRVRGYNASNVQVATYNYIDVVAGIIVTLPASFSNVSRVEIQSANAGGGVNNHLLDDITLLGASDTTPPVVTAPAPLTVECNSTGGVLTSDPAIQSWLASASATDDVDSSVAVSNDLAVGLCAVGTTTTVTFSASDAAGNTGSGSSTITVVDTTPPTVTSATASRDSLWPPNHKMVPVSVSVSVSDVCDPSVTCAITSVTSNEPVDGLGDGGTAPDWEITGPLTVELRAERSGTGTGRVYTITVTCTDHSGNTATKTVTVTVPHDKGK